MYVSMQNTQAEREDSLSSSTYEFEWDVMFFVGYSCGFGDGPRRLVWVVDPHTAFPSFM